MATKLAFDKGDVLMEFGVAYKITDIKTKKSVDGSPRPHIFYTPMHTSDNHEDVICSLPVESVDDTSIRKPLQKPKLTRILRSLSERPTKALEVTPKNTQDAFNRSDIEQIAQFVIWLEYERHLPETTLSATKKDILEKGINHICQEVAVVLDISLSDAKEKVGKQLAALAH